MTPEEKLNYLREYIDYYVLIRTEEAKRISTLFYLIYELGIVPYGRPQLSPLMSFEEYLKVRLDGYN